MVEQNENGRNVVESTQLNKIITHVSESLGQLYVARNEVKHLMTEDERDVFDGIADLQIRVQSLLTKLTIMQESSCSHLV